MAKMGANGQMDVNNPQHMQISIVEHTFVE